MALDVATLDPLILYRKPGIYITIEHVLHCEKIIHIPTLFYYFAIPTPFFHFHFFLYIVEWSPPCSKENYYTCVMHVFPTLHANFVCSCQLFSLV